MGATHARPRSNSARPERCWARSRLRPGGGAILVVPTAPGAASYARELAADGAVLGSVLTFSGLAREVANRAGYTGRRLTPLQRERVLEASPAGYAGRRAARRGGTAGLPGATGELIAELERSLVTPQRFAAAMRTWAEQDARRPGYARDVAAIYQAYAAALERLGGSTGSCTPGGARRSAGRARPVGIGPPEPFLSRRAVAPEVVLVLLCIGGARSVPPAAARAWL